MNTSKDFLLAFLKGLPSFFNRLSFLMHLLSADSTPRSERDDDRDDNLNEDDDDEIDDDDDVEKAGEMQELTERRSSKESSPDEDA